MPAKLQRKSREQQKEKLHRKGDEKNKENLIYWNSGTQCRHWCRLRIATGRTVALGLRYIKGKIENFVVAD